MDKALNYLALARKAGLAELGEEPVAASARAQHARLVIVAKDASDHTWRRAKSMVAGTTQLCIRTPFTKDELGIAVGRTALALGAFTDPALALEFVKALDDASLQDAVTSLQERVSRTRQRRNEAKAHKKNKRVGKVRHGKKEH